jgi:hypothetical protein
MEDLLASLKLIARIVDWHKAHAHLGNDISNPQPCSSDIELETDSPGENLRTLDVAVIGEPRLNRDEPLVG